MKELKLGVLANLGSVSRCAPRKPGASESLGSCKNKETYIEEGVLSQDVARPWARALVPSWGRGQCSLVTELVSRGLAELVTAVSDLLPL